MTTAEGDDGPAARSAIGTFLTLLAAGLCTGVGLVMVFDGVGKLETLYSGGVHLPVPYLFGAVVVLSLGATFVLSGLYITVVRASGT